MMQSSDANPSRGATRRQFLQSAGAGFASASLTHHFATAAFPAEQKARSVNPHTLPIIDTHQHLWDLSRFELPWLKNPAAQALNRSYLLADYREATHGYNIERTIYMEVNIHPDQQAAEAEYVLELCRQPESKMVAAVIGGSPQSTGFKEYIQKFAGNKHVKGVRTVLHDPDRPKGMCLEPRFVDHMQLLGKLGLSFDLCLRPGEIADGVKLIEKCPGTRFIIDHCGNMDVQSTDEKLRNAWKSGIKAASQQENVACKISGIVVTAKPETWKPADLAPVVNHCLDSFGEDRVFFGGDWPVCTLKGTYAQWASGLFEIVRDRTPEFQRKLFHDNAVKFYGLDG